MGMILFLLMQASVIQINSNYPERITIVATADEPRYAHHPILDDPKYAHLLPYTVTVRTRDLAIKTINVVFDVVDEHGELHSIGCIYTDSKPGKHALERHSEWTFWPGGRMSKDIKGEPLMQVDPIDLEHAQSVTFSIDYMLFEDGLKLGPNYRNTEKNLASYKGRQR